LETPGHFAKNSGSKAKKLIVTDIWVTLRDVINAQKKPESLGQRLDKLRNITMLSVG
jgi:hypothetical protein